jgi:hypothetical protein
MREHDENDDNIGLNPAERELEAALAGLSPTQADRLDPLAAAFTAGRGSAQRQARIWRSMAMAMLVIGAGGWLSAAAARLGPRTATPPERPTVLVNSHGPAIPQQLPRSAAPAQSWLMLRGAVLDGSLERLPASPTPATQTMRAADML